MNLDDLEKIKELDTQNMLGQILALPDHLLTAWRSGLTQALPEFKPFDKVLISGMGGSAIGADLLRGYVSDNVSVPVIVHRDYGLPGYATGENTLVIASSHSGNTEETLAVAKEALKRNCQLIAVCTGGKLRQFALDNNLPVWTFDHKHQPRSAVGYSFGLLLALFYRLGLIADQEELVNNAVSEMKTLAEMIAIEVPAMKNAAKRYAGQMVDRWVTVFGSGILATVAMRWKGQINENANAMANYEILPEADHNTLAGIENPARDVLGNRTYSMFLACASDHPRNRLRQEITRQTFMLEGLSTDLFIGKGADAMSQMWTTILFGDYVSFYLAIAYGSDPTKIEALVNLKQTLSGS